MVRRARGDATERPAGDSLGKSFPGSTIEIKRNGRNNEVRIDRDSAEVIAEYLAGARNEQELIQRAKQCHEETIAVARLLLGDGRETRGFREFIEQAGEELAHYPSNATMMATRCGIRIGLRELASLLGYEVAMGMRPTMWKDAMDAVNNGTRTDSSLNFNAKVSTDDSFGSARNMTMQLPWVNFKDITREWPQDVDWFGWRHTKGPVILFEGEYNREAMQEAYTKLDEFDREHGHLLGQSSPIWRRGPSGLLQQADCVFFNHSGDSMAWKGLDNQLGITLPIYTFDEDHRPEIVLQNLCNVLEEFQHLLDLKDIKGMAMPSALLELHAKQKMHRWWASIGKAKGYNDRVIKSGQQQIKTYIEQFSQIVAGGSFVSYVQEQSYGMDLSRTLNIAAPSGIHFREV